MYIYIYILCIRIYIRPYTQVRNLCPIFGNFGELFDCAAPIVARLETSDGSGFFFGKTPRHVVYVSTESANKVRDPMFFLLYRNVRRGVPSFRR